MEDPADEPLFAGPGEVRALLRARDWRGFPFGPPTAWPPVIRQTMAMLLDAPEAMGFYWGPDCLYFYNDANIGLIAGLGLALALVKSLVHLHGGTVTCASAGLGRGSTFTVCLPCLVPQAGAVAGRAAPEPGSGKRGGPLRIMVVDDNVDAASILAMVLEAAGHQVHVEYDARAALARSRDDAPRVFLLDIGLPGMDGNELARHLRSQPQTAGAMLVAITGYGQEHDRAQTAAAGFDHHLVKPVAIEALYAILDGVAR